MGFGVRFVLDCSGVRLRRVLIGADWGLSVVLKSFGVSDGCV